MRDSAQAGPRRRGVWQGSATARIAWLPGTLLVACAYTLAALLAFVFGLHPAHISPVYPAAGVAVALRIILGRRVLPGVALGNAAATALALVPDTPAMVAASVALVGAASAAAEAELAGFAMRRFTRSGHLFDRPRDTVVFLAVSVASALASAVPGSVAVVAAGLVPPDRALPALATWLSGDAVGIAVFAPLVLAWWPARAVAASLPRARGKPAWRSSLPILPGVALAAVIDVFSGFPVNYLYLLILLWAGFHAGVRGTTLTVVLVSASAVLTTVHGLGSLSGFRDVEALILLQCFMAVVAFTGLLVVSTRSVQQAAELALAEHNRHLEKRVQERTAELTLKSRLLADRQQRIDEELAQAHTLQQAILPADFSSIRTVEIAAAIRPALEMSGDFYDVFALPGDRLGILVADVSGKGIAAAFLMAVARTLVRQLAMSGLSPAACIARANDELCRDNPISMFVTLLYADLHPLTGELVIVNAGHCCPVLLHEDEATTLPSERQPALGVLPEFPFVEQRITIGVRDTVFFYTDGVTEAFDPDGRQFQEFRLRRLLAAHAGRSVQGLLDSVLDGVTAFTAGAKQSDDITCLALRRAALR